MYATRCRFVTKTYKVALDTSSMSLRIAKDEMNAKEAADAEQLAARQQLAGTAAEGIRSPLAAQLAGMAKPGAAAAAAASAAPALFGASAGGAAAGANGAKKPLIVDLSQAPAAAAGPRWEVSEAEVKGAACYRVTVDLPDVSSAADVELEVQDCSVLLLQAPHGGSPAEVRVPLGGRVDDGAVRAKFDSKKQQLVVTLPKLD